MLKYNINDHMYVQVTDEGWLHLLKTVGQEYIDNCIKPYEVEICGEIWHKMQCWSVFDLMPPVFGGKNLFMPGVMIESEGIREVKGMKDTKSFRELIAKIKKMPIEKVEDTIQKIINSEAGIMSHRFENVSLIYQMLGKEAVNCLIEQIKAGEVSIVSEHKENDLGELFISQETVLLNGVKMKIVEVKKYVEYGRFIANLTLVGEKKGNEDANNNKG